MDVKGYREALCLILKGRWNDNLEKRQSLMFLYIIIPPEKNKGTGKNVSHIRFGYDAKRVLRMLSSEDLSPELTDALSHLRLHFNLLSSVLQDTKVLFVVAITGLLTYFTTDSCRDLASFGVFFGSFLLS